MLIWLLAGAFSCAIVSCATVSCATVPSFDRPSSKSLPIIWSMFMTSDIALPMNELLPSIRQVTFVPPESGTSKNLTLHVDAKGLVNSSFMSTPSFGLLSSIVIRPSPAWLLPFQA